MIGHKVILTTDGEVQKELCLKPPALKELQAAVGGYIEQVPGFTKIILDNEELGCAVFCNEHGKLKGLPPNELATHHWRVSLLKRGVYPEQMNDVLVGDVLVVYGDKEFMGAL